MRAAVVGLSLLFLGLCSVVSSKSWLPGEPLPDGVSPIKPSVDLLWTSGAKADNITLAAFVRFAERFERVYPSVEEMLYRLKVYEYGARQAYRLHEESQKVGGANFGITKFTDISPKEFKTRMLMPNMPPIPEDKRYPHYAAPNTSIAAENWPSPNGPPRSFDWRNHPGAVSGVYNQGSCGSCWAFSATENHESRFALQHRRGVQSMSVQQILDCDSPGQYGCNGGWPYQAWEYIYYQGGQDRLDCYPYQGYVANCRWNRGCNAGSLHSWTWCFPHDEPRMLLWVWGNAPLSICVDAEQWQYYTGGVVASSQCGRSIDHCVLLTGWDMEHNPPYWNVRNSWGTDWGMNGYIALQYNGNTCGMADYPASCHTA
jgi:hypothetical protein